MPHDPAALSLDCPVCQRRLYKMRAGQWTVETRILKFVEGAVLLKCDACRTDVPVPWLQIVAVAPLPTDPVHRGVRTRVHVDARRGA
jgi:hypothetical protein